MMYITSKVTGEKKATITMATEKRLQELMNREHQSNEAKFLAWALEEYKCECGCGGASIKEIRKYAEQGDWLRDEFCFDTEGYMEDTARAMNNRFHDYMAYWCRLCHSSLSIKSFNKLVKAVYDMTDEYGYVIYPEEVEEEPEAAEAVESVEETTVSETETVEETADGKRGITMTIKELRKEFKRKLNSLNLLGLDEMADYYTAEWVAFEELYREGTVRNFSNDFLADANHYQRYMREYENLSILQTLDLHSISATKKVTRDMMAMFLDVDGWVYGHNSKYEKETVESVEETTVSETETVETEVAEKYIMRLTDDDGHVLCIKVFVGTSKEADEESERVMAETGYDVSYVRYTDSRWNSMEKKYYCGTDSKSALSVVVRKTETAEQETELNAEVAQVETEQTAEPETFSKSKSESESEPTAENITVSGTNQGNINVLIVADIANTFEMITHTGYFDTS